LCSGPFREGGITLGEYLVVFPFGWDFLFTFSLKGEDLIMALENSVSLADQTNLPLSAGVGRFLSVRKAFTSFCACVPCVLCHVWAICCCALRAPS
jgi:hypothetical protein